MAGEKREKKGFWSRIFSSQHTSEREEKVLEYIVHRTGEGVPLREVMEEEYVKRNATRSQREDILSDPRLVQSARERMKESFESGDLDPRGKRS
ncbi:Hypothetical Protein RradSPS_1052 [Rubrobacter radiotolerans]|uniref:Uncharacterized protein n=1 Tax=Rubrobacter radiotolerans TaxID=42256 RepID=A0A023X2V2_RUBRA|nr:hypothetical protein [Rubrobacter radiotolerans]AHY46335.1 Hypothetical Protein RradSPS_1052 [Rubrobacter radiotolerans]MDX5893742.1 hypothetical protein [Rubrobacter radiotolerans]SMC04407.1 conserved hypothetical protein [Rubrobacter radiotolerans DSM 5868]